MSGNFKIAIVGAGPGGMSAAARAAELGISHVLLEAAAHPANTIERYPKRKLVMSEPKQLPLRSSLRFESGTREAVLDAWRRGLAGHAVNLRLDAEVVAITGQRGDFRIALKAGEPLTAEFVVLAIGLQGNLVRLGVPGEDLPGVQYHLADPDELHGETIVMVGGGDAAIEDALALSDQNRVIVVSNDEFNSCKKANYEALMAAVARGRMETRPATRVERIATLEGGAFPLAMSMQTPQGLEHVECHRIIGRLGAHPPRTLVESFGVRFQDSDLASVPELSEHYESNVPGLYIVGALAGYPLIKQAMNQGYEAVEYILGRAVEPADEALLRERFAGFPGIASVRDGIAMLRDNQPLLAPLTTLQLREFMLESSAYAPQPGEVIFRKNDVSTSFFSVMRGRVEIHVRGVDGQPAVVTLAAGDFFGEMGLLSGRRRSATAIAGEDCVLIETPRRSMLKLLQSSSSVQRRLDETSLKRILNSTLRASLSDADLDYLARSAKSRQYAAGELLFKEGDAPDGLYMIRRGSVTVSRIIAGRDVVLAYLSAGSHVGEAALESKAPRTVTVRAASPTTVTLLEAEHVNAVTSRNAATLGVRGRYVERVHLHEPGMAGEFSGFVKFLIEQGVGEATDVLLIDYSRCIRCNNCEAACAAAHDGTSRLDREAGPTYQQVHVPSSCRHCEHPHCMKDCPADAIHRSGNGEVLIDDTCIGCGNCRNNCPYGVIQMASRQTHKPSLLSRIFGRPCGRPDAALGTPDARKAVKCDMCKNIVGVCACVRACPTGAAFRVSPEIYFETHLAS